MTKILDYYKKSIPLIIFVTYIFGYIFLTNYYMSFGVEIIYFLSLTDILFTSIELLISFSVILLFIEISLFFLTWSILNFWKKEGREEISDYNDDDVKENEKNQEGKRSEDDKVLGELDSNFLLISIVILLISGFSLAFFTKYDVYIYSIMFTLLPINIYFFIRVLLDEDDNLELISAFISVVLVIVLSIISYSFSKHEAEKMKEGNSVIYSMKVSFVDDNIEYSTLNDTTNIVIGETHSNLFLYNKLSKKTFVFYKSNLKGLNIYDPSDDNKEEVDEVVDGFKNIFRKDKVLKNSLPPNHKPSRASDINSENILRLKARNDSLMEQLGEYDN